MANSKRKDSKGGPYVPLKIKLDDPRIEDKVSAIFKSVDDIEYYREVMLSVPLGKPVWSYWVTSRYGTRSDPFKKTKARHKGVDLASRTGNKVNVKGQGKVIRAEYAGAYGNLVVVDHGNGFQTKYAHLNKIYVKKATVWKLTIRSERSEAPDVQPGRTSIMRCSTRVSTLIRCPSSKPKFRS